MPNTPENLRQWIRNPGTFKPGSLMPALDVTDHELDQITGYLRRFTRTGCEEGKRRKIMASEVHRSSKVHKSPLAVIYEWLATADHKKIGLMYIVYALLFLVIGGIEAILMRIQLAARQLHLSLSPGFQPPVHDARHDGRFLRGHADSVRLRQLPCAADDRGARHGLPAPECL